MKPQEMFKKLQSSYQCSFKFKILKMCKKNPLPIFTLPSNKYLSSWYTFIIKKCCYFGAKKKEPIIKSSKLEKRINMKTKKFTLNLSSPPNHC